MATKIGSLHLIASLEGPPRRSGAPIAAMCYAGRLAHGNLGSTIKEQVNA